MRRSRFGGVAIGLLVLLGTALLAPALSAQRLKDRVLLVDPNGNVYHTNDAGTAIEVSVRAPAAAVMAALVQAYQEAGLPVGTLDSEHGQIGNTSIHVSNHQLAGKRLALSLDCGMAPMVGERANFYEAWVTVMTHVAATDDSTTLVSTEVDGQARPMDKAGDIVHCPSTGYLEKALFAKMEKRLTNS